MDEHDWCHRCTLTCAPQQRCVGSKHGYQEETRPSLMKERHNSTQYKQLQSLCSDNDTSCDATRRCHLHRARKLANANSLISQPSYLLCSTMLLRILLVISAAAAQSGPRLLEVVSSTTANIPCDVPIEESKSVLVLWYKGDIKKAIYVFDARKAPSLSEGEQRSDGDLLRGDRALFLPLQRPPVLRLQDVTLQDEALYMCKLFIGGRSYVDNTNLTVIVAPDDPTIINSAGKEIDLDNVTYNEGVTIDLTCQVKGGKPRPEVRWYWDKQLLDESHDAVATDVVRNRLLFGPLTRNHTNARMVCHASTYKLVKLPPTVFWINVQFKPTSVLIISEDVPMMVGETQHLQCQSLGASPPATLSWWLHDKRIDNVTHKIYEKVTMDGNMTLSTLEFTPVIQDNHKRLECRARSPVIDHVPLVDNRTLVIHYLGSVKLSLESPQASRGVVEGSSVTLRCDVDADPPPALIIWSHKIGHKIQRLPGVEGPELTLSSVNRNQSGVYTCVAANTVGEGHSNPVMLQVNFKPTCQESGIQMIGTGLHEEVKLACRINSSPDSDSYRWQLKSSGKVLEIQEDIVDIEDQLSILRYTPKTDFDYGMLLCWATNSIGEQLKPCRFELVSAVLPASLANCSSSNNDTHTVYIDCVSLQDKGLPLTFVAEVYDITRGRLLRNVTSPTPSFSIEELDPGSGFTVETYSSNIRGQSEKLTLFAFTEPLVKKSLDYSSIHVFPITPILGILVGTVGAVVVMALIVAVVMKLKSSKATHDTKLKCGEPPINMPLDDRGYNQKYDKGGCRAARQTLINFPPEPPCAVSTVSEKSKPEEASSATPLNPSAPPVAEVEYAELEFPSDKKAKKKKKSKSKKKKKEMKDKETEYASIDHVRTMLNSQQLKLQDQLNDELKHQQHQQQLAQDLGQTPLIQPENAAAAAINVRPSGADDRGPLVLPDGALESSV